MSIGVKGVENKAGIIVWRFFLGLVEAGFVSWLLSLC